MKEARGIPLVEYWVWFCVIVEDEKLSKSIIGYKCAKRFNRITQFAEIPLQPFYSLTLMFYQSAPRSYNSPFFSPSFIRSHFLSFLLYWSVLGRSFR